MMDPRRQITANVKSVGKITNAVDSGNGVSTSRGIFNLVLCHNGTMNTIEVEAPDTNHLQLYTSEVWLES